MIDLSEQAGFPLLFDPHRMDVQTGSGLTFTKGARRYRELQPVLAFPAEIPPDTELYWNFKLADAGPHAALLQPLNLTLGLVLLPPLKIGSEYIKTHGHYHSAMRGSPIGYPEVYTQYLGTLLLYLQRRNRPDDTELDDCVIYEMRPGCSIMIPPGYAHILINSTDQPALMAGLYSLDSIHDYQPVIESRGAGYYFVQNGDDIHPIPNPLYPKRPGLRTIRNLKGTRFAPPDDRRPLWTSFLEDPADYRFLAEADAAQKHFLPEDHKR